MKKYSLIIALVCSVLCCYSQGTNNYCKKFTKTIQIFNDNSISPIVAEKINEEDFINKLISTLDPKYVLFNYDDIKTFERLGESLKNNMNNSYCENNDILLKRYTDNLKNSLPILEKLKNVPFDFSKKDSFYIGQSFDKNIYLRSKESRWESLIKFYMLQEITDFNSVPGSFKQLQNKLDSLTGSIKQNIIEREEKQIQYILNTQPGIEQNVYDAYVNSLLIQFDPYSYSFSEETFREFREQLSTFAQSFGIELEQNKTGKLIISSVIPGSYAWRTGRINTGDEVLKLQAGSADPLIIKDVQLEDIVDYLANETSGKLIVTLSDNSGTQKEITLQRENTEQIENSVQALVLNGKHKTGYILLPAFYTTWDSGNSSGCAQDVGKAIYKLKKENIESLIIDLRNNGGGAITEAIDLAGIFIDFGTLSIGQNSKKEIYSIKDFNRGTMYTGPLAILINKNSASASEMVAAVLQDYNRAIVIGDTSYGKATGQSLIPVDSENKDVLKVTTTNYYRVTGKSYGHKGVVPDIILPAISYSALGYPSEKGISVAAESVSKKTYYTPLNPIPIEKLKTLSEERIAKNDKFREICRIDSIINSSGKTTNFVPLNLKPYYSFMKIYETIYDEIGSLKKNPSPNYTINYLENDKEMMQLYKYYSDILNQISESVITDPYIEEVYNILNDYKTLKINDQ